MQQLKQNQKGIASIFIAMIIAIVLTLIVLGFASVMRRERRQALDQQLSNQAFYAAESALNEKYADLRDNPTAVLAQNDCDPADETFTNSTDSQTTCVLVNPAPGELEYDEVTTDSSTVVILDPVASGTFDHLIISWELTDGGGNCAANNYTSFPASLGANDIGYMRIDLTRLDSYGRDAMRANTFSALLAPRASGGSASTAFVSDPANSPQVFGQCDSSLPGYTAKARIEVNSSEAFLLRLRGVHKSSRVRVQSENGVAFDGAQVVIDSTAKVQDVVRRIQGRVPLSTIPGEYPDFALRTTDSLCKLVETYPGATNFLAATCP